MIKVLILRRLKKKFVNRLIESDRKLVFPEILYFYDASMKNRAIQDYLRVLSWKHSISAYNTVTLLQNPATKFAIAADVP